MTNHARAIELANRILDRDILAVELTPGEQLRALDRIMMTDPSDIPDGPLTEWVIDFLCNATFAE